MSKTYVQLMQDEIDGLKAERDKARRERCEAVGWVIRLISLARAGDAATLASATDAADNWLHRDDPAAFGPEVAACADALIALAEKQDPDTAAALRWAGAGAEEGLRETKQSVCPACASSHLKRGRQNMWCAKCGFFPIEYRPGTSPEALAQMREREAER
jgi:hypothetical protein